MSEQRDRPDKFAEFSEASDLNISVTHKMADAGALALASYGPDSETLDEAAIRIYLAMEKIRIEDG